MKEGEEDELTRCCACNYCNKVYTVKDSKGNNCGTKNMLDHVRQCRASCEAQQSQMTLSQCMTRKPQFSKQDICLLRRREAEYCVDGYHSFRSVEHSGFRNMMQTFVDMGAKHGKFDVKDVLFGRKAVSRETGKLASEVKNEIVRKLKDPVSDGTVSVTLDLYTDDYRKKAYLDVHAQWVDANFDVHHTALAVRHFGTAAHTG
jgi:hypothetical protein